MKSYQSKAALLAILSVYTSFLNGQTAKDRASSLLDGVSYNVEMQATASEGKTPLWLNANKQGLSSIKGHNGFLRAGLFRSLSADSARLWSIGYGVDLAGATGFTSTIVAQQLYFEAQYQKVLLTAGSKERGLELKNDELSSGSQTLGINARPIPQVRIELPEYLSLTGKSNLVAFKGHISYGAYTDNNWQKNFVTGDNQRVESSLYHSKAGFLRIGNEDRFPLVFEGGLEMACQFGGIAKNIVVEGVKRDVNLGNGIEDFLNAFVPGGSDPTDGKGYANASGNTVGSWLFSLSYKFPTWKVRAYLDHFFEDHSMMFVEYGWKDGLYGLEITLPKNKFVNSLVYEYLYSKDQAGAVYHDHTDAVPDQISAVDNYYNHAIYGGWQHWGQAIGNPLYTSPLYNDDRLVRFSNNRIVAHHLGINGDPTSYLHYRCLFTYSENWGTYAMPFADKKYSTSVLAEITYSPEKLFGSRSKGWSFTGGFSMDRGALLGNNSGAQITVRKRGLIKL